MTISCRNLLLGGRSRQAYRLVGMQAFRDYRCLSLLIRLKGWGPTMTRCSCRLSCKGLPLGREDRVWEGGLWLPPVISSGLDETELENLAKVHTEPPTSTAYERDVQDRKEGQICLRLEAGTSAQAGVSAKVERRQGEGCNWRGLGCSEKASQGPTVDGKRALRKQRPRKTHTRSCTDLPPPPIPTHPSPDFSEDELREAICWGASGKSVGEDGISLELLRRIAEVDRGCKKLLKWFNSLLHTEDLPARWHQSAMILLPNVARPVHEP